MDKDNFPLVSVCIPTFNGEKFINEALNTVLNQTYKNIEIIISDDGSVDSTIIILKEKLLNTEIPYHIYNHKPNGIGSNWNNCIEKSNGQFIKFLFQDDLMRYDCIEKMMELAILDYKIGLVYCKRTILHDFQNPAHLAWINYGGTLHKKWHSLKIQQGVLDGKKYLSDLHLMREPLNKIGEPTAVLIRKTTFYKAGFFSEDLKQSLDIEYWYRIMKYCKIGFIDEELVSFRLHDDQASFINNLNQINETDILHERFYKSIFWCLHPKKRWKSFKRFSQIGNFIRYLKKIRKVN